MRLWRNKWPYHYDRGNMLVSYVTHIHVFEQIGSVLYSVSIVHHSTHKHTQWSWKRSHRGMNRCEFNMISTCGCKTESNEMWCVKTESDTYRYQNHKQWCSSGIFFRWWQSLVTSNDDETSLLSMLCRWMHTLDTYDSSCLCCVMSQIVISCGPTCWTYPNRPWWSNSLFS